MLDLARWIRGFKSSVDRKKGYLVYGSHGSGKTTLIKKACENAGVEIFEINSVNITPNILKIRATSKIVTNFYRVKYVILIDDIDTVAKRVRGFISQLCSLLYYNSKKKPKTELTKVPIIITSIEKPWGDKKKLAGFCVTKPAAGFTVTQIRGIIKSFLKKNPSLNLNQSTINDIINRCDGNMGYVISQLKFFGLPRTKTSIKKTSKFVSNTQIRGIIKSFLKKNPSIKLNHNTINDIINRCDGNMDYVISQLKFHGLPKISHKKKTPIEKTSKSVNSPFILYEKMISGQRNVTTLTDWYFYDTFNIPNFIHENYPSNLSTNRTLRDASYLMNSISEADVLQRWITKNQKYKLAPTHGLLSTVIPVKRLERRQTFKFPRNIQPYYPFYPTVVGKHSKAKGFMQKKRRLEFTVCENTRFTGEIDGAEMSLIKILNIIQYDDQIPEKSLRMFQNYEEFKFWTSHWKRTETLWKKVSRSKKIKVGHVWREFTEKKLKRKRKRQPSSDEDDDDVQPKKKRRKKVKKQPKRKRRKPKRKKSMGKKSKRRQTKRNKKVQTKLSFGTPKHRQKKNKVKNMKQTKLSFKPNRKSGITVLRKKKGKALLNKFKKPHSINKKKNPGVNCRGRKERKTISLDVWNNL
jgi:hypothetical protein